MNSLATIMNEILCDLINTGEVASFIDNIIVGTKKEEEYNKVMEEAVKRLTENDLYVNPEKCKQKVREVGFFGVAIGLEEIKIEEEKMKRVLDWPTPKEVNDMQKCLGLANYYQQFLKYFISIARPLYDLVKKDQNQNWTEEQEKVFRKLKKRFIRELVLIAPDLD